MTTYNISKDLKGLCNTEKEQIKDEFVLFLWIGISGIIVTLLLALFFPKTPVKVGYYIIGVVFIFLMRFAIVTRYIKRINSMKY